MLLCCVRSGEVVSADVGDFRVEGDICALWLRRPDGAGFYAVIPLDEETASSVRAHIAYRGPLSPDASLFAAVAGPNAGGRLNYKSVNRILREALAPVGEAPWTVSMVKTALASAVFDERDAAEGGYVTRMEAVERIAARLYGRPVGGVPGLKSVIPLEAVSTAIVTTRSLRRMLEDFAGDDKVVVSIDGAGHISIAPHVDALQDAL